ncbi:sushi domain-containing protein 1 isoform X4 [Sceloporus undulatus]|uniref:sushi domain-containing protein 1 isoform X4 n=1 Tax=Sceloporus undulatus TaxID=8520 RepID=UPI001C4D2E06|nr:sushi domain-containing protein 1 isoform X4 [Sceloporus undulatus]
MVSQGGRRLPGWPLLLLLTLLLSSRSSEEEKETDSFSDVCATCHANATCQQKDGKNVCICNYGFVGNGRTYCQDKDECQIGTEKICGNHTSCHNTYGSFYCVCLEGFQASSKNKIFIPNDGTNCIDIDECEVSDICGPGARCVNTMGSFECYCMEGYQVENGTEPFHSIASKASCKVVNCGIPPSIPNAYFAPVNKTTYGSKVIYTCQPGYVFESGNWTSVCNTRQQWEGADIVCKEINCGKPPWIQNTDIFWDNTTTLGSTIFYKCREGFQYSGGHNFSRCTVSQKWENITFECREITCGQPPLISDSDMKWNGMSGLRSVVEYKCRKGFYPKGIKHHSLCTRNGTWEILDLRCEKKKIGFSNISIFNDTCIKWDRESGRTQSEETYIFHIQGLRWYQKQFYHKVTLNFTTNSQTPEMCLQLPPGSNYTVNISTANLDHSILLYMTTQITDPQSPEIEFISVQGSLPSLHLRKAEERNGPISSYQAIVIPWSSQCSFNCYSLTSLTYFGKGTDSDGYVAAEFPAYVIDDDRLKFALGDRLYYGKYYNAPLKQGKDYCIILRTVSEWNGVRTQSCVIWAQIKDLSSPPQHLTVVILGSIAAFGSILFLLFCIACTAVPTSPAELAKRQFLHKTGHLSITISTGEQSAASSSVIRLFLFSNAHIYQSCGRGNTIRRGNQWLSSSS